MSQSSQPAPGLPSPSGAPDAASARETRIGVLSALGAYGSWGVFGLYFNLLSHVPSLEVVAARVVWAFIFLWLFFALRGRLGEITVALRQPRVLITLTASSILISLNWLTYVFAVTHGHATEASLGYFIVPMVNVAVGYVMFSERLSRLQMVAICLALAAILVQLVLLGTVPVVSLVLAVTFGLYGYLRKIVAVRANLGLLIEVMLLSPFALIYMLWLEAGGQGHMFSVDLSTTLLMISTGIATSLPLIWFSAAARRLRMASLGIMQYLNPSLQFLMAVFVLGEVLSMEKLVTFCLIWLSVALYSYDALQTARKARPAKAAAH